MIPTINVVIIAGGVTKRFDFHQENIPLEKGAISEYLAKEYNWPDPFDFSVENGIKVWTTFAFTQEEAREYDKIRKHELH